MISRRDRALACWQYS